MSTNIKEKCKAYIQRNLMKILTYTVLVLLICTLIGIFTGIYKLMTILLPSLVALIIDFYLIYKTIYLVCRLLTFPGSSWLWRRNLENHFSKLISHRTRLQVKRLIYLAEYIQEKKTFKTYIDVEEVHEVKKMITALSHNFSQQVEHGVLSEKRKSFMSLLISLEQALKNSVIVHVSDQIETITFWKFLDLHAYEQYTFAFEKEDDAHNILNKCRQLEARLLDLTSKKPFIENVKRWLFDDTLGSIDQIREDLQTRYDGKRLLIPVDKNATLDCMLLRARKFDDTDEQCVSQNEPSSDETMNMGGDKYTNSKPGDLIGSTMIFCNPNAGFYEYMYFENEWIEYYVNRGYNLFVWNYRGYGKSTGTPDPQKIREDGEIIVDYLRSEYNAKKIGIHGESLGGMVASSLAKTRNLDFLCADRTFNSLTNVARCTFGKFLATIYLFTTRWNNDSSEKYLDANCYKIITFDPRDEVVPIPGSLKSGVTSAVVERSLGLQRATCPTIKFKNFNLFSVRNYWLMIQRFSSQVRSELRKVSNQNKIDNYSELLSNDQLMTLYEALSRVSGIIVELSKTQNLNVKRHKRSCSSEMATPRDDKRVAGGQKPRHALAKGGNGRGGSLDSSIQFTAKNSHTNITSNENDETIISILKHGPNGKSHDDSMSFYNDNSKIMVDGGDQKSFIGGNKQSIARRNRSYLQLLDEETKKSTDFLNFVIKVFSMFESMEAGGIHLNDICIVSNKAPVESFREFIRSMEIWGSYQPLKHIYAQESHDINHFHNITLNKIKEFVKKLDNFLSNNRPRATSKLETHILDDLDVISSIFPIIYQKLYILRNKSPRNQDFKLSTDPNIGLSMHIEEQQFLTLRKQDDVVNNKKPIVIELPQKVETELKSLSNTSTLGHLIPLSCGHNGALNNTEKALFDYHLKRSGFA
jgi:hypothetical protein